MNATERLPKHFDWVPEVLPDAEIAHLLKAMREPLDVSIRLNSLKVELDREVMLLAQRYGWELEPVPFCPSGFWIQGGGEAASRTIEHRMGIYYIQEAASMLPVELFNLDHLEQPLILDLAASPGGKTTHLAARTHDRGLVIANDASRSRIPALQIVLANWGAVNQAVTCLPGEVFGTLYPDTFDAVLLDAPCSMQGLRTSASHAERTITEKEIDALAQRQARLLDSALRALKIGGQVVYATCTLTPQEDEGVLAAVLQKYPHQVKISNVRSKLPQAAPGLDEVYGQKFPLSVRDAIRIWPHIFGTAGFFTAKLEKMAPLPEVKIIQRQAPPRQQHYRLLNQAQTRKIAAQIEAQYGFKLEEIMEAQTLRLFEVNQQVYLMPTALREKFNQLPWLSGGMQLGKSFPDGWQPSHEFLSRFGSQFTKSILQLEDEYLDAWQRGEDIRGYPANSRDSGKVVLVRDRCGRNLGRGKLLADRLRNMLPTHLF